MVGESGTRLDKAFTQHMEQLQQAYVGAVAAAARCSMNVIDRDTFAKDALLTRPSPVGLEETSVYVQLKSTTTKNPDPSKTHFGYQFKKRSYMEDLACPGRTVKVILIVMAIHPDQSSWCSAAHDVLTVRHCCYWKSLDGETVPAGVQNPSTKLSTASIFDAAALTGILDRIERGQAV